MGYFEAIILGLVQGLAEFLPISSSGPVSYTHLCVDLFAGTGNLGLEALSRGAKRCYFCDNARQSLELVKKNVKKCGAEDKSVILAGDYSRALGRIREQADIFFLDPPYSSGV